MTDPVKKKVDESWKEQAASLPKEPAKPAQAPQPAAGSAAAPHSHEPQEAGGDDEMQARFDLFISSLAMETLIALGDMAHPVTKRQQPNIGQAKYLIDVLGVLEEKTKGNLSVDEERLLKDALYQLRMRYLAKSGGVAPA